MPVVMMMTPTHPHTHTHTHTHTQEAIKPHEMRALNFLVHEYLNEVDNKLTAITFTEENGDQVSVCSVACVRVSVLRLRKLYVVK